MKNTFLQKRPKNIGNYQLGEIIGKGANGLVYKGLSKNGGIIVAIKQIVRDNLNKEKLSHIQSEIDLLKKLNHKHIVKYIDFVSTETHMNIVLEYVENGSMNQMIKSIGTFEEPLAAYYIKQVLSGLHYLHNQCVVHRDIKGANILMTKQGVVKLADFGVAAKINNSNYRVSFVGTPYWMPPEVVEMRGNISPANDIWSVGCTLIEFLTGNPPYSDINQYSAMFNIVEDEFPPLPSGISEECKDFLILCFEKDPEKRISAHELMDHPWIQKGNQMQVLSPLSEAKQQRRQEARLVIEEGSMMKKVQESDVKEELKRRVNENGDGQFEQGEIVEDTEILKNRLELYQKVEANNLTKNANLKAQKEIYQHFLKLNQFLIQEIFMEQEDIITTICKINIILKKNPQVRKEIFEKQDLHIMIEILDDYIEETEIIHVCLEFFNLLIEYDEYLIIQCCKYGLITTVSKFIREEFPKMVLHEAVYFIGTIVTSSEESQELFISCGGVVALSRLFELPKYENLDLMKIGADSLFILLGENKLRTFHVLEMVRNYLIEQLLYIIDIASKIEDAGELETGLVIKCFECILSISTFDNLRIKIKLTENKVIEVLQIFLKRYESNIQLVRKIIKIFKNINQEPSVQSRLEVKGLIPLLIRMIYVYNKADREVEKEILNDMLTTLFLMTKLSPERQEQLSRCDGIQLLVTVARTRFDKIGEICINILCTLVQSSEKTRRKMIDAGVLTLFTEYIENNFEIPRIFDSFYIWFQSQSETKEIEKFLCSNTFISIFIKELKKCSDIDFSKVVNLLVDMLGNSYNLCLRLSREKEFFAELVRRVNLNDEKNSKPMVQKDFFEVIYALCTVNSESKELINDFNLYMILVKTLHSAQNEEMVILEEIVNRLIILHKETC